MSVAIAAAWTVPRNLLINRGFLLGHRATANGVIASSISARSACSGTRRPLDARLATAKIRESFRGFTLDQGL